MKRVFVAFAMAAAFILSALPAPASGGLNHQHQLVPLYSSWWLTNDDWERACRDSNAKNIGSTMIANQHNGPGPARDTSFAQALEFCHDFGQNVIGYVDTSYGKRPLAAVKADIDSWYGYYNGDNTGVLDTGPAGMDTHIDGIFLDQVWNFPSDSTVEPGKDVGAYYRELFLYVRAKDPNHDHDQVTANPGAPAPTAWQLDDGGQDPTQIADEVVVFEGPLAGDSGWGLEDYVKPSWVDDYPASDIAMLVYDVPASDIASTCQTLKDGNAGLVDVTNYTVTETATPWNFFQDSTYWSAFRAACG